MNPFLVVAILLFIGGVLLIASHDPVALAELEVGVSSAGHARFDGPPMKYAIEGETPLPWCGRFVRFVFATAGKPLPGNRFLVPSVSELEKALDAAGALFQAAGFEPRRGDLVILHGTGIGDPDEMPIGGHHVGLVTNVDAVHVDSIDGDFGTPDAVRRVRRRRDARNIAFYGRIA